jgi:hypothetical protein
MGINPDPAMEGADLSEVIRGQSRESPDSVLLMEMVTTDEGCSQGLREWRGVRTRRYTYARWFDGTPWLLYNNACDPLHANSCLNDPQCGEIRERLEAELDRWLQRTGDRSLAGDELLREQGLVTLLNAREKELRGNVGRFL